MSKTYHTIKGVKHPAKTAKKWKDKKHFGFTSGTHSQFEAAKEHYRIEFETTPEDSPWYKSRKEKWEKLKNKSYPVKGKDYVKYGYGQFK